MSLQSARDAFHQANATLDASRWHNERDGKGLCIDRESRRAALFYLKLARDDLVACRKSPARDRLLSVIDKTLAKGMRAKELR